MSDSPSSSSRPRVRYAAAAAVLVGAISAPVSALAGESAHVAAAGPSLTHLSVTPAHPKQGRGFKVHFRTGSGGSYVVFFAGANFGGALLTGSTRPGVVITKTTGKSLHAGSYTIGVDLTSAGRSKRYQTKLTVVR